MATTIYFVSETVLKNNSPISLNVEPQLLNIALTDAQEMHVQMALGSLLYEKLKTLISTGDISTATYTDYKTLLDNYVVPATISWALVESLSYIRFKIMNKSVTSQASDNTAPADLEELKYLHSQLRDKAEFKQQRLINYLIENRTKYSEYTATTDIDDIDPACNGYFSGIVLDDDCDCSRYLGLNSHTEDII